MSLFEIFININLTEYLTVTDARTWRRLAVLTGDVSLPKATLMKCFLTKDHFMLVFDKFSSNPSKGSSVKSSYENKREIFIKIIKIGFKTKLK